MEDILLLVGAYYTDATSASRLKQTCRFYNTAITYTRLRRVLARTLLTHNCPLRSLAHRFHTTLRADYHFAAVCREILNTTTVEKSALDAVLIKAAECGYQQVTELLLSLGRDVDLCCTLKTAALRGQLEVVRVYLAFLRTAKQEDWYFGLGFLAAIVGGHEPVVRLVLDVCGKSVLNDYALLTPTRRGYVGIVRLILERMDDPVSAASAACGCVRRTHVDCGASVGPWRRSGCSKRGTTHVGREKMSPGSCQTLAG